MDALSDRLLENLLEGLPAPVAPGRFDGDALTVLQVNRAFEEVCGAGAEGEIRTTMRHPPRASVSRFPFRGGRPAEAD